MSKEDGSFQSKAKLVKELVGYCTMILFDLFFEFDKDQLKQFAKKKGQLRDHFRQSMFSLVGTGEDEQRQTNRFVAEWGRFYRDVLGMNVDFSHLVIPTKPNGDFWLIVVTPGLTYNVLVAKLRSLFDSWVYTDDLDKVINMNKEQRRAIGKPYAIWVRARVEADEENANKSANDLSNTPSLTLMERFLLEGIYFKKTGKHLDISNVTLCAGSRRLDGFVPGVDWDADVSKMGVYWSSAYYRDDDLRARTVFS